MDKEEEEEEEGEGSVKQARTLERAWNKSMMNVQLAVFNQGSKQGLSVWAASLSRLKLSQAHKATSAGCINYSKGPFWTNLWGTGTSSGLDSDKIVLDVGRVSSQKKKKRFACIYILRVNVKKYRLHTEGDVVLLNPRTRHHPSHLF